MSKSSVTTAPKLPTSLPTKSAWAKGPPPIASASSSPRSQSPAPSAQTPTHSRRPSALSNIPYKDGVAMNANAKPSGQATIKFGSVSDKLPLSPPPPDASSTARPEPRKAPIQSFGSIDATTTSSNGVSTPPASSTSSAASTASGASTAATTPASTPLKPKVDVSALFRGSSSTNAQSPVTPSMQEMVSSPQMRSQNLSPQVHNLPLAPAGPAGPSPLSHSQQPPPGSQPPYHAPFVPQNMRQQSNVSMANAPRSPGFQRQMTNGVGPAGGRPPANVQSGPNNAGMPSPRVGPQAHHQPIPQHQMQQQQHPMQPVGGVPPGMPPNMQPMAYPGWPGYYYYPQPGTEYQMYQQWHHPMGHVPGAPQPPPVHPSNMPVSPRQQPAPLQQAPATPPTIPPPLPSARLNSGASSFVPGGAQARIRITDALGHEVSFRRPPTSATASPSPPPISLEKSQNRRPPVRIESEEERKKRVAEEEAKSKAKTDAESKAKKEKDGAELKARKKEEEEKERVRKEEEEKTRAAEEEKRKKAEEDERLRKEEEEKKRKEEEEKRAEEERVQKAAEEERLRKEAEEAEKIRKDAEEKERLEKEAEKERIRKETEEAERQRKDEEERKKQEERVKEEETKSKAKADETPSKPPAAPSAIPETVAPISSSPESRKQRPIPGPLDLSSANRSGLPPPLPSALATARHIQDLGQISYPEGFSSPKPELNVNARDGKFRYDRDFLLQFMKVCVEKPDNLPNLEAIGPEPVDQNAMTRGGSGRRGGGAMGPPSTTRSASIGLGINPGGSGFAKSSGFAMGQFSTPGKIPSTSEDRFMRSTSMGAGAGGLPFTGRPSPMIRTSSQGGAMPSGSMGSKRTRSKRGEARNDSNRINSSGPGGMMNHGQHMEPVAPLEYSKDRWVPMNNKKQVDENSDEVIDRKVRALLNKLTPENFDSISDQIITWANKSEHEKDGHTLIRVIKLVFEKATDEAKFSEMYARLCRKMMEQISPNISDESLDKPITGGQLFRKYLLNRCQEDFERGWNATRAAAAAAAAKAGEDQATKEANEKKASKPGEEELYSDEYYVAQKAKRQGLGLVCLIGELFKLQMLTEKIMHGCIKKFLKDVDNPEEADIESLCTLLKIIGKSLDKEKAIFHMNVYFDRIGEISNKENIPFRMKSMLLEVIELRSRNWVPRSTVAAAPTTIAQIHENAARERAQKEREDMNRSMAMSRGGSRRGVDRGEMTIGPDGWAVAGGSGPAKTTTKAGDLSNFGKINKAAPGQMTFGPSSVFSKKDAKRDSGSLSRTNSSSNMFHMLSQNPEIAAEVAQPSSSSSRGSRAPSRTASVDLSAAAAAEIAASRPKLNLLPRSKPSLDEALPSAGPSETNSEDEGEKAGVPSMSSEKAEEQIEKDVKEFFDARNITEGESYFTSLPSEYHHLLVDKLIAFAIESKEANAKLVADLFGRAVEKTLCSPSSFEEGFNPTAEALEDIVIDSPKAFDLMAMMMKGASLDEERRTRIAGKSEDGEKLLALLG